MITKTILTRAQREALLRLWLRTVDQIPPITGYLTFRRRAEYSHLMGCVMVPFAGMWVGIEKDGYTHS